MARKKKQSDLQKNAGLTIIFVSVVTLIITFYSGGIWILNVDFSGSTNSNNVISGGGFNAEVKDEASVDVDALFANIYFRALSDLSNSIAFGTTWLEVCETGQIEKNGEIYVQVCSERFHSKQDIINSLSASISVDYIQDLMADNFVDQNGSLYIKPVFVNKDNNYVEFVSYRVAQKNSNKIIYMVKSKYGELECGVNCNYTYKEHKFSLINEGNKWVVSNLEMPY